ncbi:MAG: fused MFS/spermidine synthase [Anaerolineales bacterium]
MTTTSARRFLLLLAITVFFTGFSALLYQVVWQRMLGLFSGSDVRSVTLITSAFLGGLGVGSLVGSVLADRLSSRGAVFVFGACNLAIGGFAFFSPVLFYDILFQEWQTTLADSFGVVMLVAFLSLLLPTTLMGLSLPLLSKAIVRQVENAAPLITLIYGMNTLGAGLGTIITGWYLVGTFGFADTAYIGGAMSLSVGLIALLAAWRLAPQVAPVRPPAPLRFRLNFQQVPPIVWGWCVLVFTSGFIAISLEIIWFRVLDVTLKSNAYTFAHLLSFYLIGDAVGSLVGARFVGRIRHPWRFFLWLQGAIALYSLLIIWGVSLAANTYPLADYITNVGSQLSSSFADNRLQWLIYLGLPSIIILPPSFMIGFYFPIVQKAVQTDSAVVGQRVGLTEVANILGNTLGGILTGLVLLHFLDTATALRIITVLGLGFVLVLVWEGFRYRLPRQRWAASALSVLLLGALIGFPNAHTLWMRLHSVEDANDFFVAEDASGVAAIIATDEQSAILANGRLQGTIPYLTGHVYLGMVPALLHPNPQNIMVVGVGSTGTPYTLGLNSQTETLRAVEIIGSELDVLREYAGTRDIPHLQRFFNTPRNQITVADGRQQLALSDIQFDIIQADAILPYSSHSGLLYSREYFETVRRQLAPGGLAAQWNASPRTEATFVSVFPYVTRVGILLMGSNEPIDYNPDTVRARLDNPEVIAYLQQAHVDIPTMREMIQPASYSWTPDTPRDYPDEMINTDLFPRDEYYLNN